MEKQRVTARESWQPGLGLILLFSASTLMAETREINLYTGDNGGVRASFVLNSREEAQILMEGSTAKYIISISSSMGDDSKFLLQKDGGRGYQVNMLPPSTTIDIALDEVDDGDTVVLLVREVKDLLPVASATFELEEDTVSPSEEFATFMDTHRIAINFILENFMPVHPKVACATTYTPYR